MGFSGGRACLPSREGVGGNAGVPVIGSGHDDGVDIAAGKQFAIVAGGEDVLAVTFLRESTAAVVHVGDSDDLDARQAGWVSMSPWPMMPKPMQPI